MAQSVPLSIIYEVICKNLDGEGQPVNGALMRSDLAIEIQKALEIWYKHIDTEVANATNGNNNSSAASSSR